MYKPYSDAVLRKPIDAIARKVCRFFPESVTPLHFTYTGFFFGCVSCLSIVYGYFTAALIFFGLNRICDVLDGVLAIERSQKTEKGAFFDIVCDFVIYAGLVASFGLFSELYSTVSIVLLLSFMTTASSFLAFAIFAKPEEKAQSVYKTKGIYYLTGLIEGTETTVFFIIVLLFPEYFSVVGSFFAVACFITGIQRVLFAYKHLQ